MPDNHPYRDFEQAGRAVIEHLRQRLGYQLFMVTRKQGDDWIVLQIDDRGYGIRAGTVMRWSDSLCARMVAGDGPQAARNAGAVTAYAGQPIMDELEIGAYVGMPLRHADGSLFGTLCGIDPAARETPSQDLVLVEMLARMLSTLLQHELEANEHARSIERLERESEHDPLTGLRNRRGWERALKQEEARARRIGSPAAVFVIDVDDLKGINDRDGHAAGDEVLRAVARQVTASLREQDIAARIGGDEFTVLAAECPPEAARQLQGRLQRSLDEAGLAVSIGMAMREPVADLAAAWNAADERMYHHKRSGREAAADGER